MSEGHSRSSDAILYGLVEDVGALKAQMKEGHRQRGEMLNMVVEIRDVVVGAKIVGRVEKLEEDVGGFKRLKYLFTGAGAVIGAGGASVGWATFLNFLKHPFGGLGGGQ